MLQLLAFISYFKDNDGVQLSSGYLTFALSFFEIIQVLLSQQQ